MRNYRIQQSIYDRLALEKPPTDIDDNEITALGLLRNRLLNTMKLKKLDTALEIGIFDGKVLHQVKRDYGISLGIGIDISSQSVKRAKQNDRLGNSFIVADAHALPFLSHSLDGAVAFDVFEHLENVELALTELNRCLKPEGKVLIHAPVSGGSPFRGMLLAKSARLLKHPDWNAPETVGHYSENVYTKDALIALFKKKGFKIRSSHDTSVFLQPLYDYILLSFFKTLWRRIFIRRCVVPNDEERVEPLQEHRTQFQLMKQISKTKKLMLATVPFLLCILAVDRALNRLGVKGGALLLSAEKEDGF